MGSDTARRDEALRMRLRAAGVRGLVAARFDQATAMASPFDIWIHTGAHAEYLTDLQRWNATETLPTEIVHAQDVHALEDVLRRLQHRGSAVQQQVSQSLLICRSPPMQRVLADVMAAARSTMPVLIVGETGTGKEILAHLIHDQGARKQGAFVAVNCAAVPNELMESELLGHAKGSFSGAVAATRGKIEAAHGGTLFLDEVHDTSVQVQAKLLRVLEDRQVTRLGETQSFAVDFRTIAATNVDLFEAMEEKRFGRDFYERLAIIRIDTPPLRERLDDIPALVEFFVARFMASETLPAGVCAPVFTPSALAALQAHTWPGNVRELRNVVFRTLVRLDWSTAPACILVRDLPKLARPRVSVIVAPTSGVPTVVAPTATIEASFEQRMQAGRFSLRDEVQNIERTALATALRLGDGSPTRASRYLGTVGRGQSAMPEGTVRVMMKRLGITSTASVGRRSKPGKR